MWATEAEAYFSVSNSSNYDWLPQSPYNIWDIVVKDQDGADIKVPWKCEESGGITLDCDWKSSTGEPGISMAFAQQQEEVKVAVALRLVVAASMDRHLHCRRIPRLFSCIRHHGLL